MRNPVEIFIKYRAFVGILGLIAVLYFATPSPTALSIGFFFIMAGMFFRGWASGYINKNQELATGGPFELTRNPLYFGNFLLGAGIAISADNTICQLIVAVYYLVFFPSLMVIEHRRLRERFGERYDQWYKGSNSFFPKLRKPKQTGFNISYYMKNREYKVLYFSLFTVAVLILKVLRIIRH